MQRLRDHIPPGTRHTALLALTTALLAVFAFSGSVLAKAGNSNGNGNGNSHGNSQANSHGNSQAGEANGAPQGGNPSAGNEGRAAPAPEVASPKDVDQKRHKGGDKESKGKGKKQGRGKAGNGEGSPVGHQGPATQKPSAQTLATRRGSDSSAARRARKFARKLHAPRVSGKRSHGSNGTDKTSAQIGWARRLAPNCKLLAGDRHGPRHGDRRGHAIGLGHRIVQCVAPEPVCDAVIRVERHKARHSSKPGHQRGRGHFRTVKVECPAPAEVAGPPVPMPLPAIEPIVVAGAVATPADTLAPRARLAGRFSRCTRRRIRVSAISFDLSGVAKIEFYLGYKLIRRIAQPRGKHTITLRTGRRSGTLRMVVTDAAGHVTTVRRQVRACPAKVTRRVQPRLTG